MNQSQSTQPAPQPVKQTPSKSPSKERFILIFLIAAIVLSVFGYAMNVDKFSDYNPPSTLVLDWYDYFKDNSQNAPSSNNAITAWPRWSAAYPYRSMFLGGKQSGGTQKHDVYLFMVYSKKPVTDLFKFEYLGSSKSTSQTGYIRARINKTDYATSDEIAITYINASGMPSGSLFVTHPSFWGTYTTTGHTDGSDVYFDFDFYYDCTDEHQKNTQLLNATGLRNISVPYAYILTCDDPPPGGSASGSPSTSSSNSTSSSSTNSTGSSKKGSDYSTADNGYYSKPQSRPDHELSVPDDWKQLPDELNEDVSYPWQNPDNIPKDSFKLPETPYDVRGEGDTGEHGNTWEVPPFIQGDVIIPNYSEENLNIPDIPLSDNLQEGVPFPPELDYPSGWPPPNPLFK